MNSKTLMTMAVAMMTIAGCGKKNTSNVSDNLPNVETMTVGMTAANNETTYSGTVEAMNGTALSLSAGGTLKQLNVSEGQMVGKGQLIAVVDGSSQGYALAASEAQVQQARDAMAEAQDYYKRMKMLHDNGSLPEVRWVEAQTRLKQAAAGVRASQASAGITRKQLGDTRLYAPFAGYIAEKQAEVGQQVGPGMAVATLMRIDEVKVKISVPEQEVSHVRQGQPMRVYVEALGGKTFIGKVVEKGVSADPSTRSYDVKILVANPRHELLPGMVCTVTTNMSGAGQSVVIPADVVQIDADNRPFVWTLQGNKAHKSYITLGNNQTEGVTVLEGLAPGQQLITEGQLSVSEGTAVKVKK